MTNTLADPLDRPCTVSEVLGIVEMALSLSVGYFSPTERLAIMLEIRRWFLNSNPPRKD